MSRQSFLFSCLIMPVYIFSPYAHLEIVLRLVCQHMHYKGNIPGYCSLPSCVTRLISYGFSQDSRNHLHIISNVYLMRIECLIALLWKIEPQAYIFVYIATKKIPPTPLQTTGTRCSPLILYALEKRYSVNN